MPSEFKTRAFRAVAGSESLKTTVPQPVATVLGLAPGDELVWKVSVRSASVIVRRGPSGRQHDQRSTTGESEEQS
jgi:bifunctional DNA-binding transcriptional regulator/antitoxin component of YhaV-PrlF toxin-antitoxin module